MTYLKPFCLDLVCTAFPLGGGSIGVGVGWGGACNPPGAKHMIQLITSKCQTGHITCHKCMCDRQWICHAWNRDFHGDVTRLIT